MHARTYYNNMYIRYGRALYSVKFTGPAATAAEAARHASPVTRE